jgi:hypothetical protein
VQGGEVPRITFTANHEVRNSERSKRNLDFLALRFPVFGGTAVRKTPRDLYSTCILTGGDIHGVFVHRLWATINRLFGSSALAAKPGDRAGGGRIESHHEFHDA